MVRIELLCLCLALWASGCRLYYERLDPGDSAAASSTGAMSGGTDGFGGVTPDARLDGADANGGNAGAGATFGSGGVPGGEPVSNCAGQLDFTRCVVVTAPDRAYDICIDGACISPGCGNSSCNVHAPSFVLPDTGQRWCATTTASIACPGSGGGPSCGATNFCGQDAQYGWDTVNPSSARYQRLTPVVDEPIVIDQVTGMVWQGCSRGQKGANCTLGRAAGLNYVNAVSYCDTLSWAGETDWHLPDAFEMHTTVANDITGGIDLSIFPGTRPDYVTATCPTNCAESVWFYLPFGGSSFHTSQQTADVRCVRRPSLKRSPSPRYVREAAAEPIVRDTWTGLTWQGCPRGRSGATCSTGAMQTASWQQTLEYCENLSWAGSTDWRSPNAMEGFSIIDLRRASPAVDPAFFPGLGTTLFWTSTTSINANTGGVGFGMAIDTVRGGVVMVGKTLLHSQLCVRGP